MKRLVALGVIVVGGVIAFRSLPRRRLGAAVSRRMLQRMEHMMASLPENSPPKLIMSVLPRQSMAVTGAINQRGEVQAVGAINEKIEGFFDVCRARGLTGAEGVLIPSANKRHLMLRRDVIDAVAAGSFHIYAVDTVDQSMEILTRMPAGTRDATGRFPARTFNERVETRLMTLAKQARAFRLAAEGAEPDLAAKDPE